jgi:hypothetical protein
MFGLCSLQSCVKVMAFGVIAVLSSQCASASERAAQDEGASSGSGRAWDDHPAIVKIDAAPGTEIFAVSDPHGGYERFANLLAAANVIKGFDRLPAPTDVRWAAGAAILVVTGDMIDKGDGSVEILDLMMGLEGQASAAGGRVVVTMGNHEAEFLADPKNDKADDDDGIDAELKKRGIKPKDFASESDPHGRWLRNLPFGVKIGSWYFSHCGNTRGNTLDQLEAQIRANVDSGDSFGNKHIVGPDDSVLATEDWYDAQASKAERNATALGVAHIVFGHNPHAFGDRGVIKAKQKGLLVKIDTGMTPNVSDSKGSVLHIATRNGDAIVEAIDHKGRSEIVWQED